MNVRHVTVLALALALLGCTPPPDPAPPSPAPTSASPTESKMDRQMRLDYEAAEKSYRTFRAEINRVMRSGGAPKATKVMRATAANGYLEEFTEIVQGYHKFGARWVGRDKIGYIKRGGYSPQELTLMICEDGRGLTRIEKDGSRTPIDEIQAVEMQVRKVDDTWKLWSADGRQVESCS